MARKARARNPLKKLKAEILKAEWSELGCCDMDGQPRGSGKRTGVGE